MMKKELDFKRIGSAEMERLESGLWFTVGKAPPQNYRCRNATVHSYLEAEGSYRFPLRIDMTVSVDAPSFCVLFGDTGRINFCSTWDDNRQIADISEPPVEGKPRFFANQMELNTPTDISIICNLKSMQVLINGEQRYYSVKEKYMKSSDFPELNAAGFPLRLSCLKRTGVTMYSFTVTESETDFEIVKQEVMPEPVVHNIPLLSGEKPTFDAMIAGLPKEIRGKVMEMDGFLRSYKPMKFRRTLEKNGNKISYVASEAGVSYAIYLSRDMLTHSLQWYILTNSRENWGKRVANDFIATLEKLAVVDGAFADRIFSYLHDCVGCYGPGCGGRSPYTFHGITKQTCHGKIGFKMAVSEFDDVMRLVRAILADI